MPAGAGWAVGLMVGIFLPLISRFKTPTHYHQQEYRQEHAHRPSHLLWTMSRSQKNLNGTQWQKNRQRHCCPCPLFPPTLQPSRAALAWYRSASFAYFPGMMLF